MTTIEIVSEASATQTIYRAMCGVQQATGATPGQALDIAPGVRDLFLF